MMTLKEIYKSNDEQSFTPYVDMYESVLDYTEYDRKNDRYFIRKYGSRVFDGTEQEWYLESAAWLKMRYENHKRMVDALLLKYEVLDNYNGTEETTEKFTGTEKDELIKTGNEKHNTSNTLTKTGEEVQENTKSGSIQNEKSYTGSEKDELIKTGNEKRNNSNTLTKTGEEVQENTKSGSIQNDTNYFGSEIVTENRTSPQTTTTTEERCPNDLADGTFLDYSKNIEKIESGSLENTKNFTDRKDSNLQTFNGYSEKTSINFNNRIDTNNENETLTFEGRTDSNTKTFDNRKDIETQNFNGFSEKSKISFNNRNDNVIGENTLSFEDRKDTNTKTFVDRVNSIVLKKHGNLGITTSQQMVESELLLRQKYNIEISIITEMIFDLTY